MIIISANLNGIRAAGRKGFFDWMKAQDADIVCVQETKAQIANLSPELFHVEGYYHCFHDAEKKGYSGVGIYSKQKPDEVQIGLGWSHVDLEGRYIEASFGDLTVASLYMPSGSSKESRQEIKFDCMERYYPMLETQLKSQRDIVICGDWNIVHKEIDIKNFRANQKNSGCLPEERQWMDDVFNQLGYVDAFRAVNSSPDQYTWWSNRGRAWENNVGWRIDYQVISPSLTVKRADIYKASRFSDHAPLIVEYDYQI